MPKKKPATAKGSKKKAYSDANVREDLLKIVRKRFHKLRSKVIVDYEWIFLRLLAALKEKPNPDYSKPGKFGEWSKPHLIYIWRDQNEEWEEIVAQAFTACDTIIIEADLRLSDVPCPPKDGFA